MSKKTIAGISVFLVLAILSMVFGIVFAGRIESYTELDDILDRCALEVTGLATVAGTASAVLTFFDQDPIAQEFAELTEYFILILAVLFLEKILMPLFGTVVFKMIVPVCFAGISVAFIFGSEKWKNFLFKIGVSALAMYLVIPASTACVSYIRTAFAPVYDSVINDIIETDPAADIQELIPEKATEESVIQAVPEDNSKETGGLFDWAKSVMSGAESAAEFVTSAAEGVVEGIGSIGSKVINSGEMVMDYGKNLLNKYSSAIAIMLITSCVIPVITLVVFIYAIKLFFRFDVFESAENIRHRRHHSCDNSDNSR